MRPQGIRVRRSRSEFLTPCGRKWAWLGSVRQMGRWIGAEVGKAEAGSAAANSAALRARSLPTTGYEYSGRTSSTPARSIGRCKFGALVRGADQPGTLAQRSGSVGSGAELAMPHLGRESAKCVMPRGT